MSLNKDMSSSIPLLSTVDIFTKDPPKTPSKSVFFQTMLRIEERLRDLPYTIMPQTGI
jgi:hypothetical protein